MASPRSAFGALLISSCIAGCTPPAPAPPAAGGAAPASAASSSCVGLPNYAVLEVGTQPKGDAKKVADNCWWQQTIPKITGQVDAYLGWQMCNSCAVDIEFKFSDLPGQALVGCNLFIDASNAAQVTVPAGQDPIKYCRGLQTVQDDYLASARRAGSTGPFVDSDPELEIAGDFLVPDRSARLAQISNVTQCLSAPSASTGRRLSLSGQFARMSASSTVVLVPSGPGLFSATWGGDLVEFSVPSATPPGPGEGPASFTVTADLPPHVTEFVLRDGGQGATIRLADTARCP